MQATEAIERLRHKLGQMVSLADAVAQTCNITGMDDTISSAREILAATATIDPAPVGAQKEQGNAIRPSAEPAGRHDASIAALARVSKWIDKFPIGTRSALLMMGLLRDVQESLRADQMRMTGAASGGNTNPEIPATQPAADHACPRGTPYGPAVCGECVDAKPESGCCNNNCNQGRNCPERK